MPHGFGSKLKKSINNATESVGNFMGDIYDTASGMKAKRQRFKQISEDMQVVREAENSGAVPSSDPQAMSDPNSLMRRKMRVDAFKQQARRERSDDKETGMVTGAGEKAARDLFKEKTRQKSSGGGRMKATGKSSKQSGMGGGRGSKKGIMNIFN